MKRLFLRTSARLTNGTGRNGSTSHAEGDVLNVNRKVAAGGVAGAVTVVLVWIAGLFGLDVPAEVASAFTVLVGFAAGYLKTA